MKDFLEVKFEGWTATPRLPFVISGNALCMHTPSYSTVLGIIGCCLGRIVTANEVNIGYKYSYETVGVDLETRHRLEFDGNNIKSHGKGTDAYKREFHVNPKLIIWIDRLDWEHHFTNPIGTPCLGQSQDLLIIRSTKVVQAIKVSKGIIGGCMLPYDGNISTSGQIVQMAESFQENNIIGSGRSSIKSRVFLSIPYDTKHEISFVNLYKIDNIIMYFHTWN